MITVFKIFESKENWTIDKVKTQLGLIDYSGSKVINPMDIPYKTKTKKLHDDIVKYFCWKHNIKLCLINYFFTNSDANFGVKFTDEDGVTHLPIYNEKHPELIDFLNDPQLFMEADKYNL